ncbi:MAG TPA: GtrA family protein, partial [Solirubrobacteraceae bacterium]|nr:GtrA family protein [Solirubrobacteraceae bacterium]
HGALDRRLGYPGRMPEDATVVDVPRPSPHGTVTLRPHIRVMHGLRKPSNWLQLVRFGLVGGVGFVVNVGVYALCVHVLGIDYRLAAVAAWMVAVTNNFVLNRHWTFAAGHGSVRFQAIRFFVVSLLAFGVSFLILTALVELAGVAKVPAQALAVALSTPMNFLGNKLWSFRERA